MKYTLITTITLSLTFPAFAMEEYDAAAFEKAKTLNKQAQKMIVEIALIVAESSLAGDVKQVFLSDYQGLLPTTLKYLTATEEFIDQQKFEHRQLQEKLHLRKKIWFFHPSEINTDDIDNLITEMLADARTLQQRLQAEELIDDEAEKDPTTSIQAQLELGQRSQNFIEKASTALARLTFE
jgi:hypothetical protein